MIRDVGVLVIITNLQKVLLSFNEKDNQKLAQIDPIFLFLVTMKQSSNKNLCSGNESYNLHLLVKYTFLLSGDCGVGEDS